MPMNKQTRLRTVLRWLFFLIFGRRPGNKSEQTGHPLAQSQRPSADDRDAWSAYWRAQGQSWRIEPEIDTERQKFLAQRWAITPDMEKGIAPFRDVKLSRADIEWLLATHEDGRGPIDWNDESQRNRKRLDLCGADVRNVNLSHLPLAGMKGSGWTKVINIATGQIETVAIDLEGANLLYAHLEGANLRSANLSRVNAYGARLEGAYLFGASLKGSRLDFSHLEKTVLIQAKLEKASLKGAHLEGANIAQANLAGAILRNAFFDRATQLDDVILTSKEGRSVTIADVRWGDVNLAVMKWPQLKILGDEQEARLKRREGKVKDRITRLEEYERAVRANRQLAVVLQSQGLNEDAARFAYRAQKLQRSILWYQRRFGQYLFSRFLSLTSGYGYRLWRGFATYLFVIVGFAAAYYLLGPIAKLSLSPLDAIIFSVTSFHGRGFSPGENIGLSNPLTIFAAIEAFVGLIIEVTFIATLTQRFFNR